ncbi:hypothetical protein LUZ63_004310 [Rhynchospora breviuscula]|uniref:J domain-containing protein n=1 Tax=Rhynchospora breviuscula TaxID=2022672 RepID=A0A9Q0HZV0_9POAL|nr:hypothetical protein LUZ63_004310 [Rhynchospora breviuscula]
MGLDYYEILHVGRGVSGEELKKAYRKLALRWHPDKNPTNKQEAEVRFKQICEAYEILIDPLKRSIYNEYGEEGLKLGHLASSSPKPGQNSSERAGFRPRNAEDIFAEFFGSQNFDFGPMWHAASMRFQSYSGDGGGGTGSFGGPRRHQQNYRSFDGGVGSGGVPNYPNSKAALVENKLPCSLEELYTGSTRKMKISRRVIDPSTREARTETEILVITVKPGWKAGTKVTFPGMGNDQVNQVSPDIVFVIDEKPHEVYKRDANDLVAELTVPLADALAGSSINLQSLDGRDIVVPMDDVVIKPGDEFVVANEGMPISKDPGKKGNLRIKCEVAFPEKLTDQQRESLRQILG